MQSSIGIGRRLVVGLAVTLVASGCGPVRVPVASNTSPTAAATTGTTVNQRCNALTISASRQSPITAGDMVTIIASAGGCVSPDYGFMLLDQTGGATVMQDWGPAATWTWNSGGTLSGQLTVRADVRAPGGTSYAPDLSAYAEFQVLGAAGPAVQTCRLPGHCPAQVDSSRCPRAPTRLTRPATSRFPASPISALCAAATPMTPSIAAGCRSPEIG